MSRESILCMLGKYKDKYPGEAATVDRFIEFISGSEQCFHRSLKEGHVTGSAWVVDEAGEKVLLTHHRKLNRWLQLGGHADGESDIIAVAMREVEEESGLKDVKAMGGEIFDIDVHLIPKRGTEEEHFHYDIRFVVVSSGKEAYQVSEESHDLSWITIQNLSEVTEEESMLRMARKWQAQSAAMGRR